MTDDPKSGRDEEPENDVDYGTFGDARPHDGKNDPRTAGSRPQEEVENRENVSTVTPEDYPAEDRAISNPAST